LKLEKLDHSGSKDEVIRRFAKHLRTSDQVCQQFLDKYRQLLDSQEGKRHCYCGKPVQATVTALLCATSKCKFNETLELKTQNGTTAIDAAPVRKVLSSLAVSKKTTPTTTKKRVRTAQADDDERPSKKMCLQDDSETDYDSEPKEETEFVEPRRTGRQPKPSQKYSK